MKEIKIPWACWHGSDPHVLGFPDEWDVNVSKIRGGKSIDTGEMEHYLNNPVGSRKLEEIAIGKNTVGILIDDISRPTPGVVILPLIISQLENAGIKRDDITIFLCLGSHRPMIRKDIEKKVGREILESVSVVNHNPFDNLIDLGRSKMGNPIIINKDFYYTDLKISIGCILPHSYVGYSGGAKNIIPGIGSIETLNANHSSVYYKEDGLKSYHNYTGKPDESPLRQDMEDIARVVGLEFIVNVVVNEKLEIAGFFAGDPVQAHREGCKLAGKVYGTKMIPDADIVIVNSFPKDIEFLQLDCAFNVFGLDPVPFFHGPDSTLVVATAAVEGSGIHYLGGPGMRMFTPYDGIVPPPSIRGINTVVYSPELSVMEMKPFFEGQPPKLYKDWSRLVEDMTARYGKHARVAIYPNAGMSMRE